MRKDVERFITILIYAAGIAGCVHIKYFSIASLLAALLFGYGLQQMKEDR